MAPGPDADVLIVGGGLAGLAASQVLARAGRRVRVLEANDVVGGRVCQAAVGDASAEMGGEFFHGGSSTSKRLADALGIATEKVFTAAHGDGGPDDEPGQDGGVALYVAGTALSHDSDDKDFVDLNDALDRMRELRVDDGDTRSVADYLRDEGVAPRMLALAAASYSNTLGVGDALGELPLCGVARLEQLWGSDGEGDYRVASRNQNGSPAPSPSSSSSPASLAAVCAALSIGAIVETTSEVVQLEVSAHTAAARGAARRVTATCSDGREYTAAVAVVALPVAVLQRGHLRFVPPLPADKLSAIRAIRMRCAVPVPCTLRHPRHPREVCCPCTLHPAPSAPSA